MLGQKTKLAKENAASRPSNRKKKQGKRGGRKKKKIVSKDSKQNEPRSPEAVEMEKMHKEDINASMPEVVSHEAEDIGKELFVPSEDIGVKETVVHVPTAQLMHNSW